MLIQSAQLKTICGPTSPLPMTDLPQIALAGRSNVGKSSLINAVLNRKKLARTSSEPGKTQTINYYLVNDAFYLTDLPGYGYAKVSRAQRAQWSDMIARYFAHPSGPRMVFQLVDIRHDPTPLDVQMYKELTARGIRPVVIAAKTDKIKRSQIQKQLSAVRTGLGLSSQTPLIPFSAVTKAGTEEVHAIIETFLKQEN